MGTKQAIKHVQDVLTIEINSVTDNPNVFVKADVISAGNFHGQPIAIPMDYLAFLYTNWVIYQRDVFINLYQAREGYHLI